MLNSLNKAKRKRLARELHDLYEAVERDRKVWDQMLDQVNKEIIRIDPAQEKKSDQKKM